MFHYSPEMGCLTHDGDSLSFKEHLNAKFYIDGKLESKIIKGQLEKPFGGIYSMAYGDVSFCESVNVDGVVNLPVNIHHRLEIKPAPRSILAKTNRRRKEGSRLDE